MVGLLFLFLSLSLSLFSSLLFLSLTLFLISFSLSRAEAAAEAIRLQYCIRFDSLWSALSYGRRRYSCRVKSWIRITRDSRVTCCYDGTNVYGSNSFDAPPTSNALTLRLGHRGSTLEDSP